MAVVALLTIATPVAAQTSWFHVHGFLTARAIRVDAPPSWTQGGNGKFDVGSTTAGERRTDNVEVGQLGFDFTPTSWLLIHADGIARREPDGTVGSRAGVVQAFADLFTEHIRLRAGAFWLPTSRENVDPMWNSRYTITYSALNTWIGQEVRPVGVDLQFSPNFYITAGATAFRANDTMGTLLAARGWTLGNRLSVYNEEVAVPPPDDVTRPMRYESDSRVGFSGRLRLQVPERAMIQFTHVDNRTEIYPGTPPDVPWNTRFNIIGADIGANSPSTLAAEWMRGKTAVGFTAGSFTMDFDSAYVLASRKSGRERFTTRYERFWTRAHDRSPRDRSREKGRAYTIAWLHDMSDHFRAGLEYEKTSGERPALANPDIGGSTWTAEVRFGF
ncbi:MAG TPA: hypothetical protein VLU46_10850 [Thermoanaerobaculia bacterium]|nr:hypothetical protein [Thermoanaerobaculia bacterium]